MAQLGAYNPRQAAAGGAIIAAATGLARAYREMPSYGFTTPSPRTPARKRARSTSSAKKKTVRKGLDRTNVGLLKYNSCRGGELKFFDSGSGGSYTALLVSERVTSLDNVISVPVGDTASNRIGKNIWIKSLHIKGTCTSLDPGESGHLFIVVVLDMQCNGSGASQASVFESETNLALAMNNLDNSGRFKILRRLVYKLEPSTYNSNAPEFANCEALINTYINMQDLNITYTGVNGTIGERTSNNIAIFAGVSNSLSGGAVTLEVNTRIRYAD